MSEQDCFQEETRRWRVYRCCGISLVSDHAKQINMKELIAGLQRAMEFGEYRNRADSDVCLHKGSAAAVCFNLS